MGTDEQFETILDGIQTILTQGDSGNFIIFSFPSPQSSFIQIAAGKGSQRLWVEAATMPALMDQQITALKKLGWKAPHQGGLYNYFREFTGIGPEQYKDIADFVLQSFREVYNLPPKEKITPKVVLQ